MFVDTHCHLCPGLDDGPRTMEEALQMCHIAWNEGVRAIAALAHQNEHWADVTPARICESTAEVAAELAAIGSPMRLVPTAEVMISAETLPQWRSGQLLSVGDHGKYLLVEFPHGLYLDIRGFTHELVQLGVRPILAHADRYPELVHGGEMITELIAAGCIVQVSTTCLMEPESRGQMKTLRAWARRGIIHVVGSDAHSPRRRRPVMAAAYEQLRKWTSREAADRICGRNGMRVLRGEPLTVQPPAANRRRSWFAGK